MSQGYANVRIAKIYFKGEPEDDTLFVLYSDKNINFGGWREDDIGRHLRLIIIGDITPDRFSKYDDIKDVVFEPPWPQLTTRQSLATTDV